MEEWTISTLTRSLTKDTSDYPSLFIAAAAATILTSSVAAPFEFLRVRSMSLSTRSGVLDVYVSALKENERKNKDNKYLPLWGATPAIISRELPFALGKVRS